MTKDTKTRLSQNFSITNYPFYLFSQVEFRYYGLMDAIFRRYRITRTSWRIVLTLREDEYTNISELAEQTALNRPTVSRAVSGLIKEGLAKKEVHGLDNRAFEVTLTPEGRKRVEEILSDVVKQYEWTIRGIPKSEINRVNKVLKQMIVNMNKMPYE